MNGKEFEPVYYVNPLNAKYCYFKVILDTETEYYIVLALDKFLTEYNVGICETFDKAVESLTNLFGVELVKLTNKL